MSERTCWWCSGARKSDGWVWHRVSTERVPFHRRCATFVATEEGSRLYYTALAYGRPPRGATYGGFGRSRNHPPPPRNPGWMARQDAEQAAREKWETYTAQVQTAMNVADAALLRRQYSGKDPTNLEEAALGVLTLAAEKSIWGRTIRQRIIAARDALGALIDKD